MAFRGVRPKPNHLRVVDNEKASKLDRDPALDVAPDFDNGLQPPEKLRGKRERELWNTIRTMPWLTRYDVYKAYMWVQTWIAYAEDPRAANGNLLRELRSLGSELGMDPATRTRVKATDNAKKSKASRFFET